MILVTGGAGFIGSNIVASLAARGEEVVVCDRLRSDGKWRNLARHLVAEIVAPEALPGWLGRAPPLRAVVHMGAISATTVRDGDLTAATNIALPLALWEWCAAHAVPLIYASSAATYGDGSAGFDDDPAPEALARLRPLNLYGWSKHVFDRRVADLVARGRPRPPQWAGLKFFNVYGPNEYHKGPMISVVKRKADEIAAGKPATLFRSHRSDIPDGHQARDFVWVGDCVDVVLWLLDHPSVSGLFNVGTGTARTYVDLVRAVFAAMNRAPEIVFVDTPEHLRAQYQYFTRARMERLRAAGYDRPFTPLEDGVATYVRDYLLAPDPYR
ncbi:ADP-glyceromanno-heptose 6-epimerase [Elioraea sp.]|uniref:ADP-glyceromanno-heptose 6-epimerase n=1 Tax=Elioraea sp. TaxID=2185103 RepID=UPI0021DCC728|nr:ADP-glyceromanno-heptose 6-epimerase [Elioraea sp.]GIX11273.1 MAG: ADP-L-glycero-D-manno-heptose-6-epimerase [Elioraea sp.]